MKKNLDQQKALKKFKKLAEKIRTCMFITNTTTEHEHTRPMATMKVEYNGTLWFFTDIRSIKVEEVSMDRTVHLTYAHPGKESYLDVWGRASVITDKEQIKEKWSPIIKVWFPDGVDDPNLGLLRVQPTECYYWDNGTGKMIEFFKMAASMVTGQRLPEGPEGKLSL